MPGFDDGALSISNTLSIVFHDESVLVLDALLVADDEVELCFGTVIELVLDDEESVGRSAVELDGLVVPEGLVTLDERLRWKIEGLVVLGKLVMPDGTIWMVPEWVGPDKVIGVSELAMMGELVVSTLERDGEAMTWLADDVAPGI